MPSLNLTIEDTSPTIHYSPGQWRAGSSDDSLVNSYSQSSFTVTNITGASLSFTFIGTKIGIFGAMRANHGMYQARLDDILQPPANGIAPDPGIFQTSLFSAQNLSQGLHTVSLTNLEDTFLDIDFITWETAIGGNIDDGFDFNTVQDTSPSFTYLPTETYWEVLPSNLGTFMGGTGHATKTPGTSLRYIFDIQRFILLTGEGVSLFGPVGPDQASYIVSVDGGSIMNLTANKEFYMAQSLLYHASSLGPGTHSLTLTYSQDSPPHQTLAVDYAIVYATTPRGGKKATSPPIGVIVGPIVAVGGLLLFGLLFVLFWRIRKRRARDRQHQIVYDTEPFVGDVVGQQMHHPPFSVKTAPPMHQSGSGLPNIEGYMTKTRSTGRSSAHPPSSSFTPPSAVSEDPPPYTIN